MEHCDSSDSEVSFCTTNYGITTTPADEWRITTTRDASLADMRHDRRLPDIHELHKSKAAQDAGLTLVEIIMLVLYTGPMVGRPRPCHHLCPCHPFL
jgi:hypothetical protein